MAGNSNVAAEAAALALGRALAGVLVSPNVADSNGEAANLVDVVDRLAAGVARVASAILPRDAVRGTDAAGTTVDSLTEAVMGVTAGLHAIAGAIGDLAGAVRERG